MTDKELLEFAAKAAGIAIESKYVEPSIFKGLLLAAWREPFTPAFWNPLTDDGDALRLAVKLGLIVQSDCTDEYSKRYSACYKFDEDAMEVCSVRQEHDDDIYKATRRAIVMAAAEIGQAQ